MITVDYTGLKPLHAQIMRLEQQEQSDWECADVDSPSYIKNKPNIILEINGKSSQNGSVTLNAEDIHNFSAVLEENINSISQEEIETLFYGGTI